MRKAPHLRHPLDPEEAARAVSRLPPLPARDQGFKFDAPRIRDLEAQESQLWDRGGEIAIRPNAKFFQKEESDLTERMCRPD